MTLHGNLLGPEPTLLPVDPAAALLDGGADPVHVASEHPTSSIAWAVLAEQALVLGAQHIPPDDSLRAVISAYAFARTGYHRGLDQLRRHGWKGFGPVPWSHEPNRGFLRALAALHSAATSIGETDEADRTAALILDCDPTSPIADGLV